MDKQKLIEYLEHIVELEKQRYAQKTAMNELQKQIDSLGNKDNIERKLAHVEPKKVDLLGIGGFIGLGVFCIIAFNAISDCHYISFGSLLLRLALAAVAGFGSIFGLQLIAELIADIAAKQAQTEKQQKYDKLYNDAVQKDSARVEVEMAARKRLEHEIGLLKEQHRKTKQTLKQFYDAGPIYSKYHFDFVAVASFLDYFKSGRCSTLGENRGGDGAYNTYENELLHRVIINKLDQVIVRLDQIKANQWSIYNAIQAGNRISAQLVEATNRLVVAAEQIAINSGIAAENSAIAAYNSQQSANELNQIKWLQLYGMTLR